MSRPGGSRDDLPTLRVTNISEDTQENDLRELFWPFGRVARVYVGRDRDTGIGKGFGFVSFEDRAVAQRAMEKMNGRGYDSLILNVQWSRKWRYCGFPSSLTQAQSCVGRTSGAKVIVFAYFLYHFNLSYPQAMVIRCSLIHWTRE